MKSSVQVTVEKVTNGCRRPNTIEPVTSLLSISHAAQDYPPVEGERLQVNSEREEIDWRQSRKTNSHRDESRSAQGTGGSFEERGGNSRLKKKKDLRRDMTIIPVSLPDAVTSTNKHHRQERKGIINFVLQLGKLRPNPHFVLQDPAGPNTPVLPAHAQPLPASTSKPSSGLSIFLSL